ncbi:MAG: hypothetical protein IKT57_05325 [Clostridia bacterium]|nr:hypothetical protein [Clostridia bacterium]
MADRELRRELLEILGRNCFLHLDREGTHLYVTDFPVRNPKMCDEMQKALAACGYCTVPRGRENNLWAIDLTREKWQLVLKDARHETSVLVTDETLPLISLARLLDKNSEQEENTDFARRILLSASFKWADINHLHRQLCRAYALCLREKKDLPGPGCAGLIRRLLKGMCP